MNQIELRALAKINLGLDVLGRRENGYHDVRMIMQSIYLYDEVKIEKKDTPGIEVVTNLKFLPVNGDNIAYKAAELLKEEFHISEGVRITLKKHIPVAAGLAGGSSNAAAVLFGMNRMFRLGLSRKSLMERGVKLGAGRSVLHYARNRAGGRHRRGVKDTSRHAEMYRTDRKTPRSACPQRRSMRLSIQKRSWSIRTSTALSTGSSSIISGRLHPVWEMCLKTLLSPCIR